jgi:predicted transcriptional regulator
VKEELINIIPPSLLLLKEGETKSVRELIKAFYLNSATAKECLENLVVRGYVVCETQKRPNGAVYNTNYSVTQKGRRYDFTCKINTYTAPLDVIDKSLRAFSPKSYRKKLQRIQKLSAAQDSPNQNVVERMIKNDLMTIQRKCTELHSLLGAFRVNLNTFVQEPYAPVIGENNCGDVNIGETGTLSAVIQKELPSINSEHDDERQVVTVCKGSSPDISFQNMLLAKCSLQMGKLQAILEIPDKNQENGKEWWSAVEQYNRHLNEKCPVCPAQCGWYKNEFLTKNST